MKPWMRFGLSLALVGGVSACSDDPSGTAYDETVSAGWASDIAESSYQGLHEMMSALGSGGMASPGLARARAMIQKALGPMPLAAGRAPRGWRPIDLAGAPRPALAANGIELLAPGCSTSESGMDQYGDVIDANDNGIPDDYRQSIRCEITDSVGHDSTITQRQEFEVLFRERAGDLFGYDLAVRQKMSITSNFGIHQSQEMKQEEGLSLRSDRATTHNLTAQQISVKWVGDTVVHRVEVLDRGDMTFTPDDPIAFESELPDGEVKLNGEFKLVNTDEPLAIRFVLDTPELLEFSPACEVSEDQPFVGGVLRGRFNGRSNIGFTIEFNSCGNGADYETFGIEEEVAAPAFAAHPSRR